MTPAINLLKRKRIPYTLHRYKHDTKHPSYGLEASEKLGLDPDRVFKTLIVQLDGRELAVALIPVNRTLNLKEAARAFEAKKVALADAKQVQSSTGYILGGVSPLAQKKALRTLMDSTALTFESIFVSGGRRGVEIELAPADLLRQCGGFTDSIC